MDYRTLKVEIADNVAVVRMDNPPVNATTTPMQEDLTSAFDSFSDRSDVRAAILIGTGRAFCGGADIKAGPRSQPGERAAYLRRWRECSFAIMETRVPVVAAINGYTLGAGLALVASCDILIASTEAVVGLPEIDRGVLGGGRRAMRLLGHTWVRSMMFRGIRIPAEQLLQSASSKPSTPGPAPARGHEDRTGAGIGRHRNHAPCRLALNTIEAMSVREGYRSSRR